MVVFEKVGMFGWTFPFTVYSLLCTLCCGFTVL